MSKYLSFHSFQSLGRWGEGDVFSERKEFFYEQILFLSELIPMDVCVCVCVCVGGGGGGGGGGG